MSRRKPSSAASNIREPLPLKRTAAPAKKFVGAAALAVVAAYVFVSAAFVLPASTTQDAVSEVAAPYFEQRWRLFAPDIARTNTSLHLQAAWMEDGEWVESEWLDVTHLELASSRGVPVPSRISTASINALASYTSRWSDLSDDQQDIALDSFIESTDEGERAIPDDALLTEFSDDDDASGAVSRFLHYDHMMARFTTAVAEAHFERPVDRIRWRGEYQDVNDFVHRFDPPQYEASGTTFGWRQAKLVPDDAAAVYADVDARYGGGR